MFARNAIQGITSAVLESAVMGTSLEDALKNNLKGALINTVAAQGADEIGDAKLDATSKALAHALLGCAMGTATAGSSAGCAPGATGAVIGEIVAGLYGDSQNLGDLENQLKNDPNNAALKQQIAQIRNTVTELAKLTGAGGALLIGGDAETMQIAMGTAQNAAVNNYLNHNKPTSLMALSEVEQYERAVSECGPSNPGACALRDKLAQRSAARDHALKDACSGPSASPSACSFQARQAIAMGNVVTGSYGDLVYANSTNGAIGLNTATVGPVTRPDNFNDKISQSTAEGLMLAMPGPEDLLIGSMITLGGKVATVVVEHGQKLLRFADGSSVKASSLTGSGVNSTSQAVELTFDKGTRTWTTPAGIDYGPGSVHGNRVQHVLDHAVPNPTKTTHSVFNVDRKEILGLVDEAWHAKGNPLLSDPGAYVVPMGRAVGTAGETNIKIIVRPGTNKIITAYPFQ